jgi:hypothetical protein
VVFICFVNSFLLGGYLSPVFLIIIPNLFISVLFRYRIGIM